MGSDKKILVEAASQLRAAIRAAVADQAGWATPDQGGSVRLVGVVSSD
jgi:hypothetical protein